MNIQSNLLHQAVLYSLVPLIALSMASRAAAQNTAATVSIDVSQHGKAISPDLFGIFFEDLNWAADGGLYAELVQNRSFEYSSRDNKDWNSLTSWELVQRDGGTGSVSVQAEAPLNAQNPNYAVLTVDTPGAGLCNDGFDGVVLKEGAKYNLSLFAKVIAGNPGPILVRLESKNGALLGETKLSGLNDNWHKFTSTITANASDTDARLVIIPSATGSVGLDVVSLFPQETFHNRPNGLRPDLAQVIADLKPKFMRFPGGCLAHGDGLDNMYRWKNTIGPVEQRVEQPNIWRYHQTAGLGYFEYFQFCEDIGAKPLPIVPAGVCCQNSGANVTGVYGVGQKGLPMSDMPAYVQEVLDLIEWANGPVTSYWGAKRAAQGHPKSFHLQYLGVGNEDAQTDVFRERFKMIYDAVKAKHPEFTVIGTVGPNPEGSDYDAGWKFANEQHIEMVDEHGYKDPQWFFQNLGRFDTYDRTKSKVYLGEYAAFDAGQVNTLQSALAEAAYMTSLERNGDVVRLASYAPLLARDGHTQWRPDMIYFTGTKILRTANYYVQQLFSSNQGDVYFPDTVSASAGGNVQTSFAESCVKDSHTGDLILKLVNGSSGDIQAKINLHEFGHINPKATCTVLTGEPGTFNTFDNPNNVAPTTSSTIVGETFICKSPAYSLTVVRIKTDSKVAK